MRFSGKLHKWDGERGFGVIRPDGGGDDLLVHGTALPKPPPVLQEALTFEVALDAKGRKRAVEVQRPPVQARVPPRAPLDATGLPGLDRPPRRIGNPTVVRVVSVLVTVGLLWAFGSYLSRDLDRKLPQAPKKAVVVGDVQR